MPCVQPPAADAIAALKQGAVLIGSLQPQADAARGEAITTRGIVAFPLEKLPRTTRAQAMDVLSSQANLAGNPAISVPLGTDGQGLPFGAQLMAAPFREEVLLRAAAHLLPA